MQKEITQEDAVKMKALIKELASVKVRGETAQHDLYWLSDAAKDFFHKDEIIKRK